MKQSAYGGPLICKGLEKDYQWVLAGIAANVNKTKGKFNLRHILSVLNCKFSKCKIFIGKINKGKLMVKNNEKGSKKAGIFTNIGPYREWIENEYIKQQMEDEYFKAREADSTSKAPRILLIPVSLIMIYFPIKS